MPYILGRILFAGQSEIDRGRRAGYRAHLDGGPTSGVPSIPIGNADVHRVDIAGRKDVLGDPRCVACDLEKAVAVEIEVVDQRVRRHIGGVDRDRDRVSGLGQPGVRDVIDNGWLVLQGYYPTQPSITYFILEYLHEEPEWKLGVIDVNVTEDPPPEAHLKSIVNATMLDFAMAVNTRDFAGNIVTTFYETGTILEVTPTVFKGKKGEEFINLAVKVERSSLVDPVNVTINKTEANSSILLYSGEDTAIAGLYSTERSNQRQGIPFLKDLPWWVLGIRYVAGYDRMEKKDKELVILLHASLMPKLAERLSAPPKDTDFKRLQRETETTVKPLWPRPGEGKDDQVKLED